MRTLERIERLKEEGRWSFRQPKKQRGVGGLAKTHWDYLLDEMVSLIPYHSAIALIWSAFRNGCD